MDHQPPLNSLVLQATSVADDVGFVALADMATGAASSEYRLIGGHMLTMLVARWRLGVELDRQTVDTDIGIPLSVAEDSAVVDNLLELGYEQTAGDRFERPIADHGAHRSGSGMKATIDVLVPSFTSRARPNRKFGERLVVTEVLGLSTALKRPAFIANVELHRLNGELLETVLKVSDEVSALTLKAFATRVRAKATDLVDVWRCLEIANTAACSPADFDETPESSEAAEIVRSLFRDRQGRSMQLLINELQLSEQAADTRFTRIRALTDRVIGLGQTP